MIRVVGLVVCLAAVAHADGDEFQAHMDRATKLYADGNLADARIELLAAYELQPNADILFALGQVEFNLHHYQEAIDYYERFMATNPTPEREALAQQAIGAARAELRRPPPPPPPPPPHREWDGVNTTLIVGGGVLGIAGGALLYYAHHTSQDRTGTLNDYDTRIGHARIMQWSAGGAFVAGAALVTSGLLRYRFHFVETTIAISPHNGASVALEFPL
ncbi:MAG: tetratricopeptide repeat protein [Kofleriaceae bacterium]